MKKLFLIILFFNLGLNAQNLDSLEKVLKTNTSDFVKAKTFLLLTKGYHLVDGNKALAFADKGIELCEKIDNDSIKYNILLEKGKILVQTSKYDESLVIYEKCLTYFIKQKDIGKQASVYGAFGVTYWLNGSFEKAYNMQSKSLKLYEGLKDSISLSNGYNNAGLIFKDWGVATKNKLYLEKACQYYFKSLTFADTLHNNYQSASAYNNIGSTYLDLAQLTADKTWLKKAEFYLNRSLQIKLVLGNKRKIAINLSALGSLYFELGQYETALDYSMRAYKMHEKLMDTASMAFMCINIGNVYQRTNKIDEAIKTYLSGIVMAKQTGDESDLLTLYESISISYSAKKNYEKAYDYHIKFTELKDTLITSENSEKLAEMSEKYDSEKKEKENQLLQTQNELSGKAIKQQKLISYFIVGVLVLALLFALFIFRGLKAQRKANRIISKQKDEVHHQKEIVEEKQKEILDSIHYAKRIQRAVITSDGYISQYVKDYFIYYQPKDIVSGDFYWALHANNKFYLATADCTGHGVPGAFMSLLNISILNEVMIEKKITQVDSILNEARKDIVKALNPKGSEESKDGMDCILACFDFENLKLEYAAANNSFYIVRNNELIICKADKMPVGKSPRDEEPFTLHSVDLQKGDTIYMLTDGLPDQFGGPKGKKYKYKQLEDLLIANNEKPLNEQQEILSNSLNGWKGNLEQVDDILLIGIKV